MKKSIRNALLDVNSNLINPESSEPSEHEALGLPSFEVMASQLEKNGVISSEDRQAFDRTDRKSTR